MTSPADATSGAGRRRRIAARTRVDFWFDVVLLLGCTLAYSYGFTGIAVHEWLGIGLGLALLAMTLCVVSGILISRVALPDLGFYLPGGPFGSRLHVLTAEMTLGLVPVHVALRWRWIVRVGRRLLTRRAAGRPG